jgi:CubicO group peptidase (beta-lactamase class C family)
MAQGELISAGANKERTVPLTAGMAPFSPSGYYGLGVLVANGWQFQNPYIDGYTGTVAYLPAQDLSVGIATTQLPPSSNNGKNNATAILAELAAYLSPNHLIGPS